MTKIGKMPYLNSEIFYLKNKENFKYVPLTPKEMGYSIKSGNIDAGPISLVDFINSESLKPLMNYCVSTKKYANSVFIFSRKKLGEIKNIYVTDETSTSVVLMKVLNRFYWNNDIFKISKEIHNSDSRLLIGDKALKMKLSNNNEYEHIIDLPDTYIGSIEKGETTTPTENLLLSNLTGSTLPPLSYSTSIIPPFVPIFVKFLLFPV